MMTSNPIIGITDAAIIAVSSVWNSKRDDLRSLIKAGGLDASRDFRDGDFRGWPLAGQDVRGIDFTNSDLRDTGFHDAIFDKTTILRDAIVDENATAGIIDRILDARIDRPVTPSDEARIDVRDLLLEARKFSRRGNYREALKAANEAMLIIEEWGEGWGTKLWADLYSKCLMSVRVPTVIAYEDGDAKDSIYASKVKFHEGMSNFIRTLVGLSSNDVHLAEITARYLNDFLITPNLVVSNDEVWNIFSDEIEANIRRTAYSAATIGHFTLITLAARTAATKQRFGLAEKFIMEMQSLVGHLNERHSSSQAEYCRLQIAMAEAQLEASAGRRDSAVSILVNAISDRLQRRDWAFRHESNVFVGGDDITEAFEMLISLAATRDYEHLLREVIAPIDAGHIGPAKIHVYRKAASQLQSLANRLAEFHDFESASVVLKAEVELRRIIFDRSATAQSGGHLVRAAVRYRTMASKVGHSIDARMIDWIEDRLMALHERRPTNLSRRNVTEISILKHVTSQSQ